VFAGLQVNLAEIANAANPGTASTNTVTISDATSSASSAIDTTSATACVVRAGWASTTGSPTISNRLTVFRKIA
jgi:hypothetical protein